MKGMTPDDVDLPRALSLLSLPREVGRHPEDGEPIKAGVGRFGPYVQHGKTYASLEAGDDVFHIGLNRAVTLIAEKLTKGPRRGRFGADPGKPVGEHPTKGGMIVAKNGRYGPYVSHNGVNATLPRDKTPETITLEEAASLIDARAEHAPAPQRPRKTAKRAAPGGARAPKKPSAKGAPPKRPAAKSSRKPKQAAE
jgi:DNA topoisomerase-1